MSHMEIMKPCSATCCGTCCGSAITSILLLLLLLSGLQGTWGQAQGLLWLLIIVVLQSTRGLLHIWWMQSVVPGGRMKVVRISVAVTLGNKPLYFNLQKVVSKYRVNFPLKMYHIWALSFPMSVLKPALLTFLFFCRHVKIITAFASSVRNYWS